MCVLHLAYVRVLAARTRPFIDRRPLSFSKYSALLNNLKKRELIPWLESEKGGSDSVAGRCVSLLKQTRKYHWRTPMRDVVLL